MDEFNNLKYEFSNPWTESCYNVPKSYHFSTIKYKTIDIVTSEQPIPLNHDYVYQLISKVWIHGNPKLDFNE